MAKRGRPSKLTPEVESRLLTAIKAGNYYDAACAYAGISYQTFRNWMAKGEEATRGQYFDFFEAVKKAESEAEIRIVGQWQKEIPNDWRAAATFLERRYPEKWGRQRHEITGEDGKAIKVEDAKASLIAKLEWIAERGNSNEEVEPNNSIVCSQRH